VPTDQPDQTAPVQADETPTDDLGVASGWWGYDGTWHDVDAAVLDELRERFATDEPPPSTWFVEQGATESVWSPGTVALEGGGEVDVSDRLPPDLPLGGHELHSPGDHVTRLFVVPRRCPQLPAGWGVATQLYALRSERSWGHGDLGDLARLARWCADRGAAVLAHNPVGDTIPVPEQQPSPYSPSSRRFRSPLYLAVEDVVGAERAADAVAVAARAARATRRSVIDRDTVWRAKLDALEAIWTEVGAGHDVAVRLAGVGHDEALRRHARFCALAERHGGGFGGWPPELRHPDSPAVGAAAGELADRVRFWTWVQLEADAQHARAASAGAPLLADLPVGFDPQGSDAWADQDLLALDCRIGAPPDEFGPMGQDWGLPPYVPARLRAQGYASWRDTLHRVLRHAGALRVDHVMGLFRLWVIPPERDARSGTYVYAAGQELFDLACMEAAIAGAALIGEDLGTVEPEVRRAMGARAVGGYRVVWFEDTPAESWPACSVGMMTTHDLPTTTGLWSSADAEDRRAAGFPEDPGGDERMRSRLAAFAGVDAGTEADPGEVVLAAHRALGAAGSDLVLVTLEDAVGQSPRPNLPGTIDEHPNWRLPLPATIEDLESGAADDVIEALGRTGSGSLTVRER
jgi:4-alpha-glucanotransferase